MVPVNNDVLAQSSYSIIDVSDQTLAVWVCAFAASHIGMSATRTTIITSLGEVMEDVNLVGNKQWTLPSWWPGDNSGRNQIFPNSLTAGRQAYRVLYTIISFITLGSALGAYLQSSSVESGGSTLQQSSPHYLYSVCLYTAALSLGAAIASLFNASPLGLMPAFEEGISHDDDDDRAILVAGLRRDDTLKFTARGLTRITRHPLILPVVPWGFATSYLAGGRLCDYILFSGLSIYAMLGCYAQDLRVTREEGSVGTVFGTEKGGNEDNAERTRLRLFFEETSFIPFNAVLDGRQSLNDICREVPWLQFFVGTVFGVFIEEKLLQLFRDLSS